jgi:hypothetical protein
VEAEILHISDKEYEKIERAGHIGMAYVAKDTQEVSNYSEEEMR